MEMQRVQHVPTQHTQATAPTQAEINTAIALIDVMTSTGAHNPTATQVLSMNKVVTNAELAWGFDAEFNPAATPSLIHSGIVNDTIYGSGSVEGDAVMPVVSLIAVQDALAQLNGHFWPL